MGVALGGSFARGRGVAGVLHMTALVTAMVVAVVQLQLVVSTAASAVFLRPDHHLLAADHIHEDFVLVAGQAPSAVGAIPGPAQNCSDPRDQQTAACVSTSIDCWSVYINNSAVMGECASFSVGNSTQLLPSPDCCSAVQSAWQLWPRRCFCSFIYFQYVQQRRRALPSLCNVTNSICQTCSAIPDLPGPVGNCGGSGKSSKKTVLAVALTITILAVCVIVALTYWLAYRRKKKLSLRFPDTSQDLDVILKHGGGPTLFPYNVLKVATKNFHMSNKLGEGGFGAVFKGLLPDGTEVAVKQLSVGSKQGNDEFLNEVMFITSVQHRNLVKLRGCCLKADERILVYEYLPNRSLSQALFDKEHALQLNWPTRLKIVLGTAQGLAYLHEGCRTRIVHRDIKASNILLDEDFTPKIADFGLARFFQDNQTHVSTRVAGTKGYLAPEYALRGQLTEKADVFSFGVVVLELVSGRSNFDLRLPLDTAYLLDWTWQLHEKKRLKDVMDPSLLEGISYSEEEALRVVTIALLCTQSEPTMRPTMTRVVAMLVGDASTEIPHIVESSKPRALVLTELPNMSAWNDNALNPTKGNDSQGSSDQLSGPSMQSGSVSYSTIEPR
ncbi:unnamed protein product [Sphagnum troendelagicum]|uniref:Protein kinase domain-containing protein n=1 Tax=Sphagnum troendelagicum TaxID=128251 RepID=A0ABP0U5W3_9BRYO